jgi:thiopeptide-type bacteriocin biosynthesis protein
VLHDFISRFELRYGDREIPLLDALDDETGPGFSGPLRDVVPIVDLLRSTREPSARRILLDDWGDFLLRKVWNAVGNSSAPLELSPSELAKFKTRALEGPISTCAVFTIIPRVPAVTTSGDEDLIVLHGFGGPSGAEMLGRFCYANRRLLPLLRSVLCAEEERSPETVFAEIVHLPSDRLGNLVARPSLRPFEIPYAGRSGVEVTHQVTVDDLLVSVRNGRVVLRSARLRRPVEPRLTTAHNFHADNLPVYRFLCTLQAQNGNSDFGFEWPELFSAMPALPRVKCGNWVLSPSRWNLDVTEIEEVTRAPASQKFRRVQELRHRRKLPRYISLDEADNVLFVDLDNVLSAETFASTLRSHTKAQLSEVLIPKMGTHVSSTDGRYAHEIFLPLILAPRHKARANDRSPRKAAFVSARRDPITSAEFDATTRIFFPGSKWLFAKLYTGTSNVDLILREHLCPFLTDLTQSGILRSWFFVRYADPEWHLRLRLTAEPSILNSEILPALEVFARKLLDDRCIWKLQFDPYEREIERYGGGEGIVLSESVFHHDSVAVLRLVRLTNTPDLNDARWLYACLGVDAFLDDLSIPSDQRPEFMRSLTGTQVRRGGIPSNWRDYVSRAFRKHRAVLDLVVVRKVHDTKDIATAVGVLAQRSQGIRPVIQRLTSLAAQGGLTEGLDSIAASYVHMFLNRLFHAETSLQELLVYEALARTYAAGGFRNRTH